jgi:superfamily II DNA or RNA helicase
VGDGATAIGYTATPLDLEGIYDELIVAGLPSECRSFGALVPAETYAPDEPDLKHIKNYKVGEDLTEKENTKAIMRPGVFGRVKDAWLRHNPKQKATILFGPDVRGSIFFAEQFCKAGVRAAHIDGNDVWVDGEFYPSNPEQRELVRDLLMAGDIKIVCNRFVLREGIDWPFVECGVEACVFGALTSYLQSCGRLLRACPDTNKQDAILIDHGGNWWRHGSVNADREWHLGLTNHRVVGERLEQMREKKIPEPITCPDCGKVRNGGRQCPRCGHICHRKSRLVVQVDGVLKPREGDIMRPRRIRVTPDTQQLWTKIYYRAKSQKWNATFRQAEAMFFRENYYYPPRNLLLMPRESGDWWRKVADVPKESLI